MSRREMTVRTSRELKGGSDGKPLDGVYACTHCDNIEASEREATCWYCGEGEMIWHSHEELSAALRDNRLPAQRESRPAGRLTLVQTCGACPEAYDAYFGRDYVGYLRLRHGWFSAWAGSGSNSQCVLEAQPEGDGIFQDDEREHWLNEGCKAILSNFPPTDDPADALYFEFGAAPEGR